MKRELDEKLENVGGAEMAVVQKHKLEMESKIKEQVCISRNNFS